MTSSSRIEQQHPILICTVSTTNDSALKQFLAVSKNVFSPTHFICPMKTAIDLAIRGKPPLIKPIQGDILNMTGNLLSLVVSNWLSAQLRKPPPKAPQKRVAPIRKNGKNVTNPEPTPVEPTMQGPYIIFLLDYPKNSDQFYDVIVNYHAPIPCHLSIEGPIQTITDKKGNVAITIPPINLGLELQRNLSSELELLNINMNIETPFEDQLKEQLRKIYSIYNAFIEYKKCFSDTCFVTIPTYPPKPIQIPILPLDKPLKSSRATDGNKGLAISVQAQGSTLSNSQGSSYQTSSLKAAFQKMIMTDINSYLDKSSRPFFSKEYRHHSEIFPRFPLSLSMSNNLSIRPDFKSNEIFLMRNAAYRNMVDFDCISRVLLKKKFEEMIGYRINERNAKEFLSVDVLSNVFGPLIDQFSEYKTMTFAGKLLLAFFHRIPTNLPVIEETDSYTLSTYVGFGQWFKEHQEFDSSPICLNSSNDIGINVGSNDLFMGMESNKTMRNSTHYFCESGLQVNTYPAIVNNGILSKLHFNMSFLKKLRFSFEMSQNPIPSMNEEEEDAVETLMTIKGVLSNDLELLINNSNDKMEFIIEYKKSKVVFDIANHLVILNGVEGESRRIITPSSRLIRYTPNPTVYHPDGSISRFIQNIWEMIDSDGKGYIKKDSTWYLQPKLNAESKSESRYFTKRKITNRTDGLSIVEDENERIVVFTDGTKYNQTTRTYSHDDLPSVSIHDETITVESDEFKVSFAPNCDINFSLKQQDFAILFNEEQRQIQIHHSQNLGVLTMIDLLTGTIANIGLKRYVYYLSEEWKWHFGRQLCSRKEIIQYFQNGDFYEKVQNVDKIDSEEIESIISNGHKPRLFVVDKEFDDFHLYELLDDLDYKNIIDASTDYSDKSNPIEMTLWFDTNPKSFREISKLEKISEEDQITVERIINQEIEIQKNRQVIQESTVDPKWRIAEQELDEEEKKMQKLYEDFGIVDM